jgi:hypothetical protein
MAMRIAGAPQPRKASAPKAPSTFNQIFGGSQYKSGSTGVANTRPVTTSALLPSPKYSGPGPGIAAPAPRIAPPAPIGPNTLPGGRTGGGGGGSYSGGGGSGLSALGAGGGGSFGLGAPEELPRPKPKSFQEFSTGQFEDASYDAEVASAESEYKSLMAQLAQQQAGFMTDFKQGLSGLGWEFDQNDAEGYKKGRWNRDNQLGAYGQSYRNMENDFSGRGMMDSTFFGDAKTQMDGRFDQQYKQMLGSKQQQDDQFAGSSAAAEASKKRAAERALAEAYTRYTSGFGLA